MFDAWSVKYNILMASTKQLFNFDSFTLKSAILVLTSFRYCPANNSTRHILLTVALTEQRTKAIRIQISNAHKRTKLCFFFSFLRHSKLFWRSSVPFLKNYYYCSFVWVVYCFGIWIVDKPKCRTYDGGV